MRETKQDDHGSHGCHGSGEATSQFRAIRVIHTRRNSPAAIGHSCLVIRALPSILAERMGMPEWTVHPSIPTDKRQPWRDCHQVGFTSCVTQLSHEAFHTAEAVSRCSASRFRATCSRRLIVPIGAANDLLISASDWPRK